MLVLGRRVLPSGIAMGTPAMRTGTRHLKTTWQPRDEGERRRAPGSLGLAGSFGGALSGAAGIALLGHMRPALVRTAGWNNRVEPSLLGLAAAGRAGAGGWPGVQQVPRGEDEWVVIGALAEGLVLPKFISLSVGEAGAARGSTRVPADEPELRLLQGVGFQHGPSCDVGDKCVDAFRCLAASCRRTTSGVHHGARARSPAPGERGLTRIDDLTSWMQLNLQCNRARRPISGGNAAVQHRGEQRGLKKKALKEGFGQALGDDDPWVMCDLLPVQLVCGTGWSAAPHSKMDRP